MTYIYTPSGIPYTVMANDAISESLDFGQGPVATAKLRCSWDNHYLFMNELLGTSKKQGNAIVRTPPLQYLPAPNLRAISIGGVQLLGKPKILPGGWMVRDTVVLTVNFGILPYAVTQDQGGVAGQPYTTVNFGVSGEFLTLPESTYRFGDGTPTNSPIGLIIPQIQINVKRYQLPYLPVAEMASVAGNVNGSVVQIGNYSIPIGTLLFTGGPSEFTVDTAGSYTRQVEYSYIYRYIPWNYYLHPNRTTGFSLVTDGNGNPPYPSGDFSVLP